MPSIVETLRARRIGPVINPALLAEVSLFNDAWSTEPFGTAVVVDLLADIRDGRWKDLVAAARSGLEHGDEEPKKALPAFTLSAQLKTRKRDVSPAEKLIAHTGWLQIDIDAKDNLQLPLPEIVRLLRADSHVGFGFISPSGAGVKAGVIIDGARHLDFFKAAEHYFAAKHSLKIDPATKDVARLCFISHDPAAWIRLDDIARLEAPEPLESSTSNAMPSGAEASTIEDLREILRFIPPRPDYSDWLRIASAVWSVLDFVEGTRVLIEWSPEEVPGEYAKKFKARLKAVGVPTLVWYAQQHGFDARAAARRKRWCGRIRFTDDPERIDGDLSQANGAEPAPDGARVWQGLENEQQGDARLWAELTGGLVKYDAFKKRWFRYTNGIWEPDDNGTARNELIDNLCAAYGNLADTIKAELREAPAKNKNEDPRLDEMLKLRKRCKKLHTSYWSSGSLGLARELPEFVCRPDDFDTVPHLLVVENGTLDFKVGFRGHSPTDHQLARAPVTYDPAAGCPRFDQFLDVVMAGDAELIAYLWRAIGYSLTGYTDADVIFFCHGCGANGKSTFNATLAMLMGGALHTLVDVEMLLTRGHQVATDMDYKKSMLEGKRRVVTDEVPANRSLNESSLKALVSGDPIIARRPYQHPYTFSPTHKLWMIGNHKPKILGTDEAIWRRIHLIPWEVTIPAGERRLRSAILGEFRLELSGILNRAIEGYQQYESGGLAPPEKVVAAVAEYREDNDQLGQFLDERTEQDGAERVRATELLRAYLAWCEDNHEKPICANSRRLMERLRELGFVTQIGSDHQRFIAGLRLLLVGGKSNDF